MTFPACYLIWSPNGLWLVTPTWEGGRVQSSFVGIMSLDRARLVGAEMDLWLFMVGGSFPEQPSVQVAQSRESAETRLAHVSC
jgi:hypothetical protein